MLASISKWVERRRAVRRRWQADARALITTDEVNAYYDAQRRAVRARRRGDRAEFYHWAKVAAEIARIAPLAQMDIETLRSVVAEEERRQPKERNASCRLRAAADKGSSRRGLLSG